MAPMAAGHLELLRPIELKLNRAEGHARKLAEVVSSWTASNKINARFEWLDDRLGFRLVLEEFTEPPALEDWGLLVGDCAHNLRSALDNLAFALARLVQDPPPNPTDIAFPIYVDQAKFNQHGRRRINQVLPAGAQLIEALQPFNRDASPQQGNPNQDALVLLQRLNNTDKHQVPTVVLVAPTEIRHACAVEFETDEDAEANTPPDQTLWAGPLTPRAVLLEHRTTRPVTSVKGSFAGSAVVALDLGNGEHPPVSETMRRLGYYTWLVTQQFHQFFR
jgi:hypothetical protein